MNMIKYYLSLPLGTLQTIHDSLEDRERECREDGDEKDAHRFYQARKDVEAILERQGLRFI